MYDFETFDHYELLDVARSAGDDEIRRAYRREMSRFHPDRFASASDAERSYADARARQIGEAYATLSDFARRAAYNRRAERATPTTAPAADRIAKLYEQAQRALTGGDRTLAARLLRQVQQLDPFYRDSAMLLASAESAAAADAPLTRRPPLPLIIGGGAAALAIAVVAIALLRNGQTPATSVQTVGRPQPTSAAALSAAPTEAPTALPTVLPTTLPTALPTTLPTALPTTLPTALPTTLPTDPPLADIERGTVLFQDSFARAGWADQRGGAWRVGYTDGSYAISAEPNTGVIWSYRTLRANDVTVAADVTVQRGSGGILLRFSSESSYLSFTIDPADGTFQLREATGGAARVIASGASAAITAGPHRLAARVSADQVTLAIDDRVVAETTTKTRSASRFGLLVNAGDDGAAASFDNVMVWE